MVSITFLVSRGFRYVKPTSTFLGFHSNFHDNRVFLYDVGYYLESCAAGCQRGQKKVATYRELRDTTRRLPLIVLVVLSMSNDSKIAVVRSRERSSSNI